MTDYYVFDSIMGSGKSSIMLNLMKEVEEGSNKYVFVVPFLSEVKRYKAALKDSLNVADPAEPLFINGGTKLDNFKYLLRKKYKRIIITHATFQNADDEVVRLLKAGNYRLMIDEEPNVVTPIDYVMDDLLAAQAGGFVSIDPESYKITWIYKGGNYNGVFLPLKKYCQTDRLYTNQNSSYLYLIYPFAVYDACNAVYILTYMFETQMVYFYLKKNVPDFHYKKFSVTHDRETNQFHLHDYDPKYNRIYDLKSLIHILNNEKMNKVGEEDTALSVAWFERRFEEDEAIKAIKRHMHNYLYKICHSKSSECLWTTFKSAQRKIEGKGYKESFLPVNAKAMNNYSDRKYIAYIANRFVNPKLTYLCADNGDSFDQDAFATSEMVQFIWRSAIRCGEPIQIYIPSSRMRGLLEKWIDENQKLS